MKTWDFMDEFVRVFTKKLQDDDARWGDTWLKRTRKGQDDRMIMSTNDRFDKFLNAGKSLDNLLIIGDAYINWVREQHPEIWPE